MEETKKQHNASRNNFLYITAFFALVLVHMDRVFICPEADHNRTANRIRFLRPFRLQL